MHTINVLLQFYHTTYFIIIIFSQRLEPLEFKKGEKGLAFLLWSVSSDELSFFNPLNVDQEG